MTRQTISEIKLRRTTSVRVGNVTVGGGSPIVVQSMTMTDTADAEGTATQCVQLAEAGSDMVRILHKLTESLFELVLTVVL